MPVVPIINNGSALSVRRPRKTIDETYAISSPFELRLSCNEAGKYRPAPNTVYVYSDRIAITPSAAVPSLSAFGQNYTYNGDIPYNGVLVGYLWIKSVDANSDGYDDLESSGSITLSNAIGIDGAGTVTSSDSNIAGIGNLTITGIGAISMKNFLAGTGSSVVTGSGTIGILSVNAPISGTGYMSEGGSGVVLSKNPISGTGSISDSALGIISMKNPIAGIGTKSIAGSGALALSSTPLSTPTLGTLTPGAGYIDVAFSGVDSHATAMTVAYRANSTGAWTEVTGVSKTSPFHLSGLLGSTLYEVKVKAHGTGSYTDSAYTTTTTTTTYVPPLTGTFYFHAGGVLNQTAPTGSEAILADGPFGGEFGGDLTLYVDPWTGIDLEGVSSLMDAADDTYHLLSDTLTIPAGCTGFDLWVNEVDFITFALGSGTIAEHTATVNVWYFASSESNSVAFITSPTHPSYVSVAA